MVVQRNLPDNFALSNVGTHPDFVRRVVGGFWDDLVHSYSSSLDHFVSVLIGIMVLFMQKGTTPSRIVRLRLGFDGSVHLN